MAFQILYDIVLDSGMYIFYFVSKNNEIIIFKWSTSKFLESKFRLGFFFNSIYKNM